MDPDVTIVQEILRDREAGAARLIAECREPLYGAALSLCGDPVAAEDLVFRTFERVLDSIATCRDESAFTAWMKTILRNEWLMSVRGATVRNTVPAGSPSEVEHLAEPGDGCAAVMKAVDAALLRDAIEDLPEDMREAVVLRYFLGLPLLKTAKILTVPVGTVNSRLHYARLLLAAKLGVAARKSGVKAVLVAVALCALTAAGAAVAGAVAAARNATSPAPSRSTALLDEGGEETDSLRQISTTSETAGEQTATSGVQTETRQGASLEKFTPSASGEQPTPAESLSGAALSAPATTTTHQEERNSTMKTLPILASMSLALATTATADDYTLAAGQTDTFSDKAIHTYETVTIAGDLAILGDTKFTATTAVNLVGGTVLVNGNSSVFGHRSHRDLNPGVTATFSPAADSGRYTKVTLLNGVAYGFNVDGKSDYANFAAKKLVIEAETAASRTEYPDGTFDFIETTGSGGGANFCEVENNSSLTGRVSVAGTSSMFGCGNGNTWGNGFFKSGNFLLDIASGKTLRFNASDKGASYNQAGCNVLATGAGNLLFLQRYNSGSTMKTAIRRGAVLDVSGTITFDCSSSAAGAYGWFNLADSGVFGPNVGRIKTADVVGKKPVFIEVPAGVAVTVHDVEIKREGDGLIGVGTVRIDATGAARTFEANIPATFGSGNTANTLTVAKIGANVATIAATNIPTLKVEEGVVSLTSDCVISHLEGASGATLIADGCTVTLGDGGCFANGLAFETANGGAFVKTGAGSTIVYAPGALGGTLHVASGNLEFSAYGLSQKFWRWTFMKVASSPNPLWIGRLWLFDADSNHAATNLTQVADNKTPSSIGAGGVCWEYNTSTNLYRDSSATQWFNYETALGKVFSDGLSANMNNFPKLATPVVDPENSVSWPSIVIHRRTNEKNVTGYNMMAEDNAHYPVSWKVEASEDGVTWTEIETRTDETHAHPGQYYFYDGEHKDTANTARGAPLQHFLFSGYKSNGLAADDVKSVMLQVDDGASVDLTAFTAAPQKIGGLVVDLAAGGGTVTGGAIGTNGTLSVVNGNPGFAFGAPLPITLSGVDDTANLGRWSVSVDGVGVTGRVKLDADGHLVVVAFGTVVYFR